MNAYEYALKLEREGEQYYRQLAESSAHPGLKAAFNILADEEVRHCKAIEDMMSTSCFDPEKLDMMLDTDMIHKKLIDRDSVDFNSTEIKFYEEAIAREDEAGDFYLQKAKEAKNEHERDLFLKLAEEEQKHVEVLQEILDFIQEPQQLVAAAEF